MSSVSGFANCGSTGIANCILPSAKLQIADLGLELLTGDNLDGVEIYSTHVPFLVENGPSDSLLRTHLLPLPEVELGEQLFLSGGLWSLYRNNDEFTLLFTSPRTGPRPYRVAIFNEDFTMGDLYVPPTDVGVKYGVPELGSGAVVVDPLLPPIDELILINLLSRGRGLYLHGCGISDGERSVAFCGVSGAGKSTLARLWQQHPVTILSDDRIVVRPMGSSFWAWGTPWHGDALVAAPSGAPLQKLFIIEHSPENYIRPLSHSEAALKLLVRCFPTFYDAAGMEFTLGLIYQLCKTVPCAELGFAPDERVVDLVLRDALGH
ncbi:MAG: hypothetical protein ACOX87_05105 [Chloroflexota bacterium]|jgi:hypothetical protein